MGKIRDFWQALKQAINQAYLKPSKPKEKGHMAKRPKPPTTESTMEKFLVVYSTSSGAAENGSLDHGSEFDTLALAQAKMADLLQPGSGVSRVWIVKTVDRGNQ